MGARRDCAGEGGCRSGARRLGDQRSECAHGCGLQSDKSTVRGGVRRSPAVADMTRVCFSLPERWGDGDCTAGEKPSTTSSLTASSVSGDCTASPSNAANLTRRSASLDRFRILRHKRHRRAQHRPFAR